jgi:hypothetical protein
LVLVKLSPKIEVIDMFRRPETKKDVRRLLGLSGYYHRFILLVSEIAAPQTDLNKKGMPNKVKWTDSSEESFQALKKVTDGNENYPIDSQFDTKHDMV